MLITKRTYKKKYVIGGAGIFGSIGKFFGENVFEQCGKAISVDSSSGRKNCSKDIGMKAIDVGKTVAIDAGKKLVEMAAKKLTTLKPQIANVVVPQIANVLVPPEEINKKINDVIEKYAYTSAINQTSKCF